MNITIRRDVQIIGGRASLLTVTKITGRQTVCVRGTLVEVEAVTITDGWGSCTVDCTLARRAPAPEGAASIRERVQEAAAQAMADQQMR